MHNPRRGEVSAVLGGERRILCLTLGGLAELEAAFGAADLAALGRRFADGHMATRDLMVILAAGLRGGGSETTPEDLARLPVAGDMPALIAAVSDLLAAAFGTGEEPAGGPPRVPQAP